MTVLLDATGWAGAACLLAAFGLLARGRLAATSGRYVVLNLVGSGGLAVASAASGAWPSVALNVVWLVIGLTALPRSRRCAERPAPA